MHSVVVVADEDVVSAGLESSLSGTLSLHSGARVTPCVAVLAPADDSRRALLTRTAHFLRAGSSVVWFAGDPDAATARIASRAGAVVPARAVPRHVLVATVLHVAERSSHTPRCADDPPGRPRPTDRERQVLRSYATG